MTKIVLVGMKSSGKTSVGRALAERLECEFIDVDHALQERYFAESGAALSYREIFNKLGAERYRAFETAVLRALAAELQGADFVLATGGGTVLGEENRGILSRMGLVVFLDVDQEVLLPRIVAAGIPSFFPFPEDPRRSLAQILEARRPIYAAIAAMVVPCDLEAPEAIADRIIAKVDTRE
ncbi:MAG: shikimate kinase [Chloroflexales bacterium]|nr:shikimate kinase [Chloroflexales bacterium]